MRRWLLGALVAFVASAWGGAPVAAKDDLPPEADAPEKVKPGKTAFLTAPKGMRYFLRVPKSYDPKAGARLIVFLHGSNMNGLDYVRSFEAKNWADDDLLVCPNGEQGNQKEELGAHNFTFGSAPLVADVTEQVQKAFKTTISYVGGHSQGGFLTYSVILNFPDLFKGAMPMAGDCWSQNEPNLWEEKPDVLKKQRDIAIAVVHAPDDPVVQFEQGQHAYGCFRAEGWQKVRLFAPEHAQHMFMVYPVDEVLDWLDAMNGRNDKKSLELADKWSKEGEHGWAYAAAKSSKTGSPKLVKAAEDAAAKAAPAMGEAMKGKPMDWIPKWLEFWRIHGGTSAAKSLVEKYLDLRDKQRNEGERLGMAAFGCFRSQRADEAYKTFEELLAKAPCSYFGWYAWKSLSDKAAQKK